MYWTANTYIEAVRNNGGIPILIPGGLSEDHLRELFQRLDGIVFMGGDDIEPSLYNGHMHKTVSGIDQERDYIEITLLRWAAEKDKPFLGICRGLQVMNVALGGTLVVDIPSEVPNAASHPHVKGDPRTRLKHKIQINEDTRLAHIMGTPIIEVNSLHHQSAKDIAHGVAVTAKAPDGVVEALEIPEHRFGLGVQWHPEDLQDRAEMRSLFKALVEAAK